MKQLALQRTISALLAIFMLGVLVCSAPCFTALADGGLYVTGYSVQDATGNELQKVSPGDKCTIVVSLRDGRFSEIPAKTDSSGNIVNVKITSTAAFSSPSLSDIRQTTPTIEGGELSYAIIFKDITYIGGENALAFDVAYIDGQVAMQNISCGISQCQGSSQQAGSKASLMVRDISYGSGSVEAGQTFTLVITSYNTSKSASLTDVKTTIGLPSSLALASGSNVTLTESVSAGGAYSSTFQLQALSSAETGPANITIDYQYYIQGSDTPLSASQIIAIPLVQPDRFSFTSVTIPDQATVGEEVTVTLNYVNKGKGTLYNLSTSATVDGGTATPLDPYLGNLASGTKGSADFTIVASTAGTLTGTATLTYEDVNGVEVQQTTEFSIPVTQAAAAGWDDYDMSFTEDVIPTPAESGMPVWGWVLLVLGVVGAVIVLIILRKKKAAKRAQMLSEDDEDEDF
jgi:hypothetical protein